MTSEAKRAAYLLVADLIDQHMTHPTAHADVLHEVRKIEAAMREAAATPPVRKPEGGES